MPDHEENEATQVPPDLGLPESQHDEEGIQGPPNTFALNSPDTIMSPTEGDDGSQFSMTALGQQLESVIQQRQDVEEDAAPSTAPITVPAIEQQHPVPIVHHGRVERDSSFPLLATQFHPPTSSEAGDNASEQIPTEALDHQAASDALNESQMASRGLPRVRIPSFPDARPAPNVTVPAETPDEQRHRQGEEWSTYQIMRVYALFRERHNLPSYWETMYTPSTIMPAVQPSQLWDRESIRIMAFLNAEQILESREHRTDRTVTIAGGRLIAWTLVDPHASSVDATDTRPIGEDRVAFALPAGHEQAVDLQAYTEIYTGMLGMLRARALNPQATGFGGVVHSVPGNLPEDVVCQICLSDFRPGECEDPSTVIHRHCRCGPRTRIYGRACITCWLRSNYTCPVCHQRVVDEEALRRDAHARSWEEYTAESRRRHSTVPGPQRVMQFRVLENHRTRSTTDAAISLSLLQGGSEVNFEAITHDIVAAINDELPLPQLRPEVVDAFEAVYWPDLQSQIANNSSLLHWLSGQVIINGVNVDRFLDSIAAMTAVNLAAREARSLGNLSSTYFYLGLLTIGAAQTRAEMGRILVTTGAGATIERDILDALTRMIERLTVHTGVNAELDEALWRRRFLLHRTGRPGSGSEQQQERRLERLQVIRNAAYSNITPPPKTRAPSTELNARPLVFERFYEQALRIQRFTTRHPQGAYRAAVPPRQEPSADEVRRGLRRRMIASVIFDRQDDDNERAMAEAIAREVMAFGRLQGPREGRRRAIASIVHEHRMQYWDSGPEEGHPMAADEIMFQRHMTETVLEVLDRSITPEARRPETMNRSNPRINTEDRRHRDEANPGTGHPQVQPATTVLRSIRGTLARRPIGTNDNRPRADAELPTATLRIHLERIRANQASPTRPLAQGSNSFQDTSTAVAAADVFPDPADRYSPFREPTRNERVLRAQARRSAREEMQEPIRWTSASSDADEPDVDDEEVDDDEAEHGGDDENDGNGESDERTESGDDSTILLSATQANVPPPAVEPREIPARNRRFMTLREHLEDLHRTIENHVPRPAIAQPQPQLRASGEQVRNMIQESQRQADERIWQRSNHPPRRDLPPHDAYMNPNLSPSQQTALNRQTAMVADAAIIVAGNIANGTDSEGAQMIDGNTPMHFAARTLMLEYGLQVHYTTLARTYALQFMARAGDLRRRQIAVGGLSEQVPSFQPMTSAEAEAVNAEAENGPTMGDLEFQAGPSPYTQWPSLPREFVDRLPPTFPQYWVDRLEETMNSHNSAGVDVFRLGYAFADMFAVGPDHTEEDSTIAQRLRWDRDHNQSSQMMTGTLLAPGLDMSHLDFLFNPALMPRAAAGAAPVRMNDVSAEVVAVDTVMPNQAAVVEEAESTGSVESAAGDADEE